MTSEILNGTPLADAIQQAQQALGTGDYQLAVDYYGRALGLVNESQPKGLRKALWIEHVGGLLQREQFTLATTQAEAYLTTARSRHDRQAEVELLVLLAEALAAQGHWAKCEIALNSVTSFLGAGDIDQLGERAPNFVRLQGLLAAEKKDSVQARDLLTEASRRFVNLNNEFGQQVVANDLRDLALYEGNAEVLNEILNGQAIRTTSDALRLARALRRDARYETAARLLKQWYSDNTFEPTLCFPLLHELALLYQLLIDYTALQELLPLLREAASIAADPAEALAVVDRLAQWQEKGFTISSGSGYEARLSTVRALIQSQALQEAEAELRQLRLQANTPRFAAYWSLVAGELEFAIGLASDLAQANEQARQALAHLDQAAQLAQKSSLPEVYSQAIRLMGRVHDRLHNDRDIANNYWNEASREDELIAHRQELDQTRIRYLEALPTPYDELIEATVARIPGATGESLSSIIVALEAARGAAILSKIFPSGARMRHLPLPNQPAACLAWYMQISSYLPKNMAIWIMHDTPDKLHHGLVGRNLLRWASIEVERHRLNEAIEELKDCWSFGPESLEALVQHEPETMNKLLLDIAKMLRLDRVFKDLPQHITRIAVVAGNALGEIPLAALPLPGTEKSSQPLITRFALSDLPCISARHLLLQRAQASRGQHSLFIRPAAAALSRGNSKKYQWLEGKDATISQLGTMLKNNQFALVRFDCHGKYSKKGLDSWLELASTPTDQGELTANHFQTLPLSRCGTLILGACESGMSQRVGRDERLGFVRAGLAAGVSSVLASRWVAENLVAEAILNRFQRYLTYLPRDQALQQAQLDILQGSCPELKDTYIPLKDHPARWACWTLYGDAGFQTNSGWLMRAFRRFLLPRFPTLIS